MRYLLLLGMVLLSACAGHQKVVAYGPMSERGGFQEKEVEPGVWQVNARSGGEAGPGYAAAMAEYRAAEMLKSRGFTWVQILKEFPRTLLSEDLGGGRRRVLSEDMELTVRGAHDPSKPTDCRQTGILRCWTFTPDMIMKRAGKRLKFSKRSARPKLSEESMERMAITWLLKGEAAPTIEKSIDERVACLARGAAQGRMQVGQAGLIPSESLAASCGYSEAIEDVAHLLRERFPGAEPAFFERTAQSFMQQAMFWASLGEGSGAQTPTPE